MSSELYDEFAKANRIDLAIDESAQEMRNGAEAADADANAVFSRLEKI